MGIAIKVVQRFSRDGLETERVITRGGFEDRVPEHGWDLSSPPWAYMKFWLEDGVPEPVRGPGSEIGFLNTRPRRRIHPNAGHPI